MSKVIWRKQEDVTIELVAGRKCDTDLYAAILSVRMQTDSRWPNQATVVDDYSDQYCMFVDGKPVGCLGVTRLLEGPPFLAEYCPPLLLNVFRDVVGSSFRFRILSEYQRSSSLVPRDSLYRHLVRETWRDQMKKGVTLDVMNIERSHLPLYRRMGYVSCSGYDYLDPVLGSASAIMMYPADPNRPSLMTDIVQEIGCSLTLGAVESVLYGASHPRREE